VLFATFDERIIKTSTIENDSFSWSEIECDKSLSQSKRSGVVGCFELHNKCQCAGTTNGFGSKKEIEPFFFVQTYSGVAIQKYSAIKSENEVLLYDPS
jgi:hypothetical protein